MSKTASRNGSFRTSSGGARTPLSTVTANRKGTYDNPPNSRIAHNRVGELGQQEGGISRSGSEPDSLLDLYKQNGGNMDVDSDIPENMYKPEEIHPEGWIHRDKLAKIENEELQAAGINLANARRISGKGPKRETSRSKRSEAGSGDYSRLAKDDKRPRLSEPAVEEEDDRSNWDLRTPEEIAAESAAAHMYSNPVLRKSGSKIPVLSTSPLPISTDRLGRDTPTLRKRTTSNNMSPDEGSTISKIRSRKNSSSNQVIVDEVEQTETPVAEKESSATKPTSPSTGKSPATTTATTTPPSSATGRKATPNSRKTSLTPKSNQQPSPSPSKSAAKSTDYDRPRTAANAPEGDPPWLATMYKTDPMLPPDQQIIPTHARKQQQAQWADAGAIPSTYDRDFSPLAVHPSGGSNKQSSTSVASPSPEKPKSEDSNAWPLKPVQSARSSNSNRPGTGSSVTGGYSTMPKVTSPPVVQSPRAGAVPDIRNSNQSHQAPARMQDQRPEENEKDDGIVKKGCGCCIVM